MQTYTLPRTGQAPLRFTGELIAEVSTRITAGGQQRNRWFTLGLYRTRAGKFPLAISYHTQWQGEHDADSVHLCAAAAEVRDVLAAFRPLEMSLIGYPAGDHYADKQARLERSLQLDWDTAVSELLGQVAGEFAEEVA